MGPSLASRLLFHSQPLPLLPLLPPDLSNELHDFVALSLRAFVSPWWSKITRYDKDFLPHLNIIITHVIRAFDSRIHQLDVPDLVFHDIPTILTQHYRDYRNVAAKLHTAYATGGAASLPVLFAHLQPHMAISHEGVIDREYYRQIVDHILKASLPPEDYEPESERIIVREVVVKVLIDDVLPKITQPWFINRSILDLLGNTDEPTYTSQPVPMAEHTSSASHSFIIIILSFLQSFSGMCLALIQAYKQAISTIKLVQQFPSRTPQPSIKVPVSFVSEQIPHAPSMASAPSANSSYSSRFSILQHSNPASSSYPSAQATHHNYAEQPFAFLSELVSAQDRFLTSFTLNCISMTASSMTAFVDKLLPHMLYNFLSPAFILNSTRTAKRTLFPNGYPGPQPPIPSPEEQAEWRAKLVAWRGTGGLSLLMPLLLGPDPSATLGAALDPLSDPHCNLRLAVFLLDRILVGLFPELAGAPT